MEGGENHTGIDLDALEARASCDASGRDDKHQVEVPSFGRWHVDGSGTLFKRLRERDGDEKLVAVTSTPPVIVADLQDADTGAIRSLVAVRVRGRWVRRAVDREALLSNTRVVGLLAPLGANVSTANARDVVAYLTECDAREQGAWGIEDVRAHGLGGGRNGRNRVFPPLRQGERAL